MAPLVVLMAILHLQYLKKNYPTKASEQARVAQLVACRCAVPEIPVQTQKWAN